MAKIFRKYGVIFITFFFIIVIGALCLLGLDSIKKYRNEVVNRETQIQALQTSLQNIGPLQQGFVLRKSVRTGEKVTPENFAEYFAPVDVPVKIGLNIVTGQDQLLNKYFRISLKEGTIVTLEDILDQKLDNTNRYFDLVIDELPIGVKVGDYLDIRITFPFSQDFLAIAHKRVEQINSGIAKVILNENEIYAYQSMLMDKALYMGTKIYAVSYVDPGAQTTAEVYYPLNKNLTELSSLNPNLLELIKQEMIAKRAQVENTMGGGLDSKTNMDLERITQQIQNIRESVTRNMAQSQQELDRRLNQGN